MTETDPKTAERYAAMKRNDLIFETQAIIRAHPRKDVGLPITVSHEYLEAVVRLLVEGAFDE